MVAPDNKVIISLPLKLVNLESYDFNQVMTCYFSLLPHIIQYLCVNDFSDVQDDSRPIVLYIGLERVDSLNEVDDYLQDAAYIQDEITDIKPKGDFVSDDSLKYSGDVQVQGGFVSDIMEGDSTKELINDIQDVDIEDETIEDEIDDIRDVIYNVE